MTDLDVMATKYWNGSPFQNIVYMDYVYLNSFQMFMKKLILLHYLGSPNLTGLQEESL